MEDLEAHIRAALHQAFPDMEISFDPYPGYGKLHTVLVWDGFTGLEQLVRQRAIWSVLESNLTDDERFATGFILTVTPAEINAMQEFAA